VPARPATTRKKPKKQKTEKKAKKPKAEAVHQLNVNKAVDKKHENKTLAEIVKLPPSAIQGLAEKADAVFARFNIKTIEDMANWKFYNWAQAIVEMSKFEAKGKRDEVSRQNIAKALDAKHEKASLKDVVKLPLSAFKGLGPDADSHFDSLGACRTVAELAKWKYFKIAQGLTTLAALEGEITISADAK